MLLILSLHSTSSPLASSRHNLGAKFTFSVEACIRNKIADICTSIVDGFVSIAIVNRQFVTDRSQLTHLDHVHGVVVGVGIVVCLSVGIDVDPVEVVIVLIQVVLHVDHEGGEAHHEGQEVEGVRAAQETLLETCELGESVALRLIKRVMK